MNEIDRAILDGASEQVVRKMIADKNREEDARALARALRRLKWLKVSSWT